MSFDFNRREDYDAAKSRFAQGNVENTLIQCARECRFTCGPWNVNEGVEIFGPGVRPTVDLEEKVDKFDRAFQAQCIAERNYEKLEMYVMELLMGAC